jgi:hypothetical protein
MKLGDDGNLIWAHSVIRNPNSALERLFSGFHFGMDDWGNWRLNFQPRMNTDGHGFFKPVGLASL